MVSVLLFPRIFFSCSLSVIEVLESYAEYPKVKGWKQENEMIEWHRVRFGRPAGTNEFVSFYVRVTILILLKERKNGPILPQHIFYFLVVVFPYS